MTLRYYFFFYKSYFLFFAKRLSPAGCWGLKGDASKGSMRASQSDSCPLPNWSSTGRPFTTVKDVCGCVGERAREG
jgi:hypothetical protein